MESDFIFKVGAFAISNSPSVISRQYDGYTWKRIWWRFCKRGNRCRFGMKMAKARPKDCDYIDDLINRGGEIIEEYEWASKDSLVHELEVLIKNAEIGQGRVVFGMRICLDNFVDPEKSYLDWHSDAAEGLWLRQYFGWLFKLLRAIGWTPWEDD